MKWEKKSFLDQKCKMKMKTRATKTEKRQMEVEWKMDKSVINAKYCDFERRKPE